MSYPATLRTVPRHVDPRSVFCTECAHSAFIHSDYNARLCLFSECGCSGWRAPNEDHDAAAEAAGR